MLATLSVDRFLSDKPLAITLAGLEELRAHIAARMALGTTDVKAMIETLAADRATPARGRPSSGAVSSTGVIQVRGTISQHAAGDLSSMLFGGATCEAIGDAIDAMVADDSISKIVLDIDSPGGSAYGVSELANKIMRARGQKPIIAVANSLAASAAYWIGAACDQFFAAPDATVGSVGVYVIHQDISKAAEQAGVATTFVSAGKYKTSGNQFEPLDDETRARAQARVDDVYASFVRDVARGRGVPEATVRSGYGEGDVLTAKAAKAEGMVDGVMTLEAVLQKTFSVSASAGAKAETVVLAPFAHVESDDEEAESTTTTTTTEDDDPEESIEEETDFAEGQSRLARFRFRARAAAGAA